MEGLYEHVIEEDGYSVAYAEVELYSGLNVLSCINIAQQARLSDRRICFTKPHDNANRKGHHFVANAENPYSLLSLDVRRGDVLRIEVCGNDHVAKDLAHRLHFALSHEGRSVHL